MRFDELSEADAVAAESATSVPSEIRVWLDDSDGTSRPAHLEQAMNSHDVHLFYVHVDAVLRPTTRAIRLETKDHLVQKLERPEVPPQVEALVLRDRPLLMAVRVRGLGSPMRLTLREDIPGEPEAMAYANEGIFAGAPGDYPCWLVFPDRHGLAGDQGKSLRLTLLDAFHRWRFYYAR